MLVNGTSFPVLDLTETLFRLDGSCLFFKSACNMTEYSFPSFVYFVTSFEPYIVSNVLPIVSMLTPKSAALLASIFILS